MSTKKKYEKPRMKVHPVKAKAKLLSDSDPTSMEVIIKD